MPSSRISRSTVHRATSIPSRSSSRQTRRAGPLPRIDLRFLDPVAESLGIYAEPLAHPCQSAARAARFRAQLEDHRHRTFPQLGGMLLP
jgi:hypothetical protein